MSRHGLLCVREDTFLLNLKKKKLKNAIFDDENRIFSIFLAIFFEIATFRILHFLASNFGVKIFFQFFQKVWKISYLIKLKNLGS